MHGFESCDLLGGNKQLESTGVLLDIYLYWQHSGSWNTPLNEDHKRRKIATKSFSC